MFRKLFLLVALMAVALTAQGCNFPHPYSIEDTQNILICGMDIEDDEVVLTVLVDSVVPGESGQEKIEQKIYSVTGKTVFEAKRNLHKYAEKRVTFYHTRYIIIGEETAKLGVDRVLQFFAEDDETNYLHVLMISKDLTAKEYLERENAAEKKVPNIISTLFDEIGHTGYSYKISLKDYASMRDIPWKSLYIPTVLLLEDPVENAAETQQKSGEEQTSQTEYITSLEGFVVFDEDKMVGFLDKNLARGMLFIMGEVVSTPISVTDDKGEYVAIEVMDSKSKITPEFDDPLSVTIEITVHANLDEYQETKDILDESYIRYLEEQLKVYVKNEVDQTIMFLKQKGVDVIDVGDTFYHTDPVKWQEIEANWNTIFSDLDFKVKVTTLLESVYVITNAVGE